MGRRRSSSRRVLFGFSADNSSSSINDCIKEIEIYRQYIGNSNTNWNTLENSHDNKKG